MKYIQSILSSASSYLVNYNDFHVVKIINECQNTEEFIAQHIPTSTKCSIIKYLSSKLHGNDLISFCRTVLILSNIHNYFISPLYGFTDVPPYIIATKFCVEGKLSDAIHHRSNVVLTPTNLTIIAIGIANGMGELHKQNIIHRNLSPDIIFLNERLHPVIQKISSARFVGAKEEPVVVLKYNIGKNNYLAPEILTKKQYGTEVDVYSYGVILFEMLTGKTPEALNSSKIENDPELIELQNLINSCLNLDPKKRPTFQEIYKNIIEKKIYFPGTNADIVNDFCSHIENNDLKFVPDKPLNALLSNKVNVLQHYQNILSNVKDPQFFEVFQVLINEIKPEQSQSFFDIISSCFVKVEEIHDEELNIILGEIGSLFEREPKCIQSFLNTDIIQKLPYSNIECFDNINRILKSIAKENPNAISVTIIKTILSNSLIGIDKIIYLFSEIAAAIEKLSKFEIIEPFLQNSSVFLSTKFASDYLRILNHLLVHSNNFPQLLRVKCITIFNQATKTNSIETIKSAYVLMSIIVKEPSDIDIETLVHHIQDQNFKDNISHLLYNMKTIPVSKQLVNSLIKAFPMNEMAPYILCKMSQQKDGEDYLLNDFSWFNSSIGLSGELIVFMKLFGNKQNRSKLSRIPQLPTFLTKFCVIAKMNELRAISSMVRRMELTPAFVKKLCSEGFVEKFTSSVLNRQDWDLLNSYLLMIESLARISYSRSYLLLFPLMSMILKGKQQTSLIALSMLTILSYYEQTHKDFISNNIIQTIAQMSLPPSFESYRKIIITHLKNSKSILIS